MKVVECIQGSVQWLEVRLGIPTASEFGNILTPEFKVREGEMPKTYLATKIAEAWLGHPLLDLNTFSVEQGTILEEECLPWLKLETDWPIERVGFILSDNEFAGCSPDGIVGDSFGLEIKCPAPHTHVKYLLNGVVPKEYLPQIYGGMWVTGLTRWKFVSYRRKMPALILEVERDEAIMRKIGEAVTKFHEEMTKAMNRLEELNQK